MLQKRVGLKKEYVIIILLISIIIVQLLNVKVDSGVFSWIAGNATASICDEIFTSLNQAIGNAVSALLDWIVSLFTNPLGPSLDYFVQNTKMGSISAKDLLYKLGISIGLFFSIIIYAFSLIAYFFNKKVTDMKDTPISLTIRFGISIAICYKCDVIVKTFLDIMDSIYDLNKSVIRSNASLNFLDLTGSEGYVSSTKSLTLLGKAITFEFIPGIAFIILLVQLFMIFKLVKAFIKLYLEMVSRYIVSCTILCIFPAFGCTAISNNTNQIFKSYIRTVISSFLLLIFNVVWFKMCFYIAVTRNGAIDNLLEYVFLLELLQLGTKLDGILRSMGLGVATSGSSLASSVAGAGRNMANAFRSADMMRHGAGGLMQAAGIATGNKAMYDAGSTFGAKVSDVVGGKVGGNNFAETLGSQGKKVDDSVVSSKMAADMASDAINNPGNRRMQNVVNSLSENKLKEAAQEMVKDSGINIDSAKMGSYVGDDGQRNTGLFVSGTDADGNEFSGIIGNRDSFTSGADIGNGKVMQTQNTMLNGETCSIDNAQNRAGSQAAKAISDAKENGFTFPKGTYIEKDGQTSNRKNAFNVVGENGNIMGTIEGSKFTMSGYNLKDSDKKAAFKNMQSEIMGGVQNDKGQWGNINSGGDFVSGSGLKHESISDFAPIPNKTGMYKATVTNEDGTKQDYVATDKGIYAASSMNTSPDSFMYSDRSNIGTFAYDVNAGKNYTPEEKKNSTSDHQFGKGKKENMKPGRYENMKPTGKGNTMREPNDTI